MLQVLAVMVAVAAVLAVATAVKGTNAEWAAISAVVEAHEDMVELNPNSPEQPLLTGLSALRAFSYDASVACQEYIGLQAAAWGAQIAADVMGESPAAAMPGYMATFIVDADEFATAVFNCQNGL